MGFLPLAAFKMTNFFHGSISKKIALLLGVGFFIRLTIAWLPQKYFYYLISDDAYYYFSIAKNLVNRGMLSADGITLTNGFHPLWLFVITPVFFFFQKHPWFSIHLVITVSAVFDTLAAFLIYKTLERLGKEKTGLWAAAFYLVNPWGLLHTMNGLETAQNNFFLAVMVYLSVRANTEWLKSNWFSFGAVCGLALLSRTDNIFVVVVLLGYLLWREKSLDSLIKPAAVSLAVVLPWLVFNHAAFGTVVQTSGTAYPWMYHQAYLSKFKTYFSPELIPYLLKNSFVGVSDNAHHYGDWTITSVVAIALLFRLRKWPVKYRPLLWTLLGSGIFIFFHLFIRWSVRPWYPQSVFILTLPVVALVVGKFHRYLVAIAAVFVLSICGWAVSDVKFLVAERSKVMLELINTKIPPGHRVGAFNSGYVQYLTDKRVVNLDGLVNNEILDYYKKRKGLEYLRKRDIRWLVDQPFYIRMAFGKYFGPEAKGAFELVATVSQIEYFKNDVFAIAVLPEGFHPPPDLEVPIEFDSAAAR